MCLLRMQSFEEHTGSVICFPHYKGRNKKMPHPFCTMMRDIPAPLQKGRASDQLNNCRELKQSMRSAQRSRLSLRAVRSSENPGGMTLLSFHRDFFYDQLITDSALHSHFDLLSAESRRERHTVRFFFSSLLFQTIRVFRILCIFRHRYCREPPRRRLP